MKRLSFSHLPAIPMPPPHQAPSAATAQTADVRAARSILMLDVIVLAIAFAFFALSVGYTIACDRL
jgi:hypothetical protein